MTDEEKELIDKTCNDAAETIKQLQEEKQGLKRDWDEAITELKSMDELVKELRDGNQRLKASMNTILLAWKRGDGYELYEDLIEKHKLIEP